MSDHPITVRFYFAWPGGTRVEDPLGWYEEIHVLLSAGTDLPPELRAANVVGIIKTIDLGQEVRQLANWGAVYDGTTLYVLGHTYDDALHNYSTALSLLRRDPAPFPPNAPQG